MRKSPLQKGILFLFLSLFVLALDAKDFKGGEVQSKKTFHYGKFETRFYASDVSGVLSTMFLYENDGWKTDSIWQEIDVEVFGKGDLTHWQTNAIWETNPAGPQLHVEEHHQLVNDSVNNWHTYTIEWTPDYIKWFIDGEQVRKYTDAASLAVIGDKPMKIMFNLWAHSSVGWVGAFDSTSLTTYQYIDYIKVYDWVKDSTFDTSTSFEDDFDGSLTNWNVSTHTFDQNYVDFATTNVKVQDGYLVLALSKDEDASTAFNNMSIPSDPLVGYPELNQLPLYGWPNPTNSIYNLAQPNLHWKLYAISGQFIKQGTTQQINLMDQPNGFYMLYVEGNMYRILKQ